MKHSRNIKTTILLFLLGIVFISAACVRLDYGGQTITQRAQADLAIKSEGILPVFTLPNERTVAPQTLDFAPSSTTSPTPPFYEIWIIVSSGPNGTISPESGFTLPGANCTYTITPDFGYQILDVKVDGVSQGNISTYTLTNIQSSHEVSAKFGPYAGFWITVSAGPGGTISPETGFTLPGANCTFTFTPDAGCHILDVAVDGVSHGIISTYSFTNIQSSHEISALFAPYADFWITVSAGPGGTIDGHSGFTSPGPETYTYTITADSGYQILDVKVDGASQGTISTYTLTNIQSNHEISATFVQTQTPTLTIVVVAGIVVAVVVLAVVLFGVSRGRKRSRSSAPSGSSPYPPAPSSPP